MLKCVYKLPRNRPKYIGKLLCISMGEPLTVYIPFSQQFILYQILTAYINFATFKEYLRDVESAQTDGHIDVPNAQILLNFLKSVNNV